MKRKKIRLRYKKERVVFSDVLPYELPITFTNRFFYRFLVKNGVEYVINPLKSKDNKLRWNEKTSDGVRQILAILFGKNFNDLNGINEITVSNYDSIPFTTLYLFLIVSYINEENIESWQLFIQLIK